MSHARSHRNQLSSRARSERELPRPPSGLWHNFGGTASQERARERGARSCEHGITHLGALKPTSFSSTERVELERHALEANLNLWARSSAAA